MGASIFELRFYMLSVQTSIEQTRQIPTDSITPSQKFNLRVDLESEESFGDLISSIEKQGIISPIIVRRIDPGKCLDGKKYEIISGHRRFAACKKLMFPHIPCIVKELDDRIALEVYLTENIQRHNLSPIEEAEAFKMYVISFGKGGMTRLASRIGKSQEYVSHRLLLLNLPKTLRDNVSRRLIRPSDATELVWLKDPTQQIELANEIMANKMSFRQTRSVIRLIRKSHLSAKDAVRRILRSNQESITIDNSPPSELESADSAPTWEGYLGDRDESLSNRISILDHAILVLRTCLAGLDGLIENNEVSLDRQLLLRQRVKIHESLDEMIKAKIRRT
jgi:ParB/RepB/Spo0J family partition protein